MDAFYAQVESVRLGVDSRKQPFALEQWHNFLAVNYPAKEQFSIQRMESIWDAQKKVLSVRSQAEQEAESSSGAPNTPPSASGGEKEALPTLLYSMLPLYRAGVTEFGYYPPNSTDKRIGSILHIDPPPKKKSTMGEPGPVEGPTFDGSTTLGPSPLLAQTIYPTTSSFYLYNRMEFKVSLDPYRAASRAIFSLLRSTPGVSVSKAGIDEAFLDVTAAAEEELAKCVAAQRAGKGHDALGGAEPRYWTSLASIQRELLDPTTIVVEDISDKLNDILRTRGTDLVRAFDEPMIDLLVAAKAVEGVPPGPHAEAVAEELTASLLSTDFFVPRELRQAVRQPVGSEEAPALDSPLTSREAEFLHYCGLLAAASRVVRRIRERLYKEVGYDCSAGIAHNQLIAKTLSASHKPRKQVLLWPHLTSSAVGLSRMAKIRGFGGKFGSALTQHDVDCRAVDLWHAPLRDVGAYAFYRLRGGDAGVLRPPKPPHLWSSLKEFSSPEKARSVDDLRAWIPALCHDLACRYEHRVKSAAWEGEAAASPEHPLGMLWSVAYANVVQVQVVQWSDATGTKAEKRVEGDSESEREEGTGDGTTPWAGEGQPRRSFTRTTLTKREAAVVIPGPPLTDIPTALTLFRETITPVATSLLLDLEGELLRSEGAIRSDRSASSLHPVVLVLVRFQFSRSKKHLQLAFAAGEEGRKQPTLMDLFSKRASGSTSISKRQRLERVPSLRTVDVITVDEEDDEEFNSSVVVEAKRLTAELSPIKISQGSDEERSHSIRSKAHKKEEIVIVDD